jgi:hypothetical protein
MLVFSLAFLEICVALTEIIILTGSVADPHHVDSDPDPVFRFDADPMLIRIHNTARGKGNLTILNSVVDPRRVRFGSGFSWIMDPGPASDPERS